MSDTELRRRLTAVADLATPHEDEAWEKLQERLAQSGDQARRPRRVAPRLLLAAAAAAALVGSYLLVHTTDDDRVRTVDDDTPTTTTSTTERPRSTTSVTTTTTPPAAAGPGSSDDADSPTGTTTASPTGGDGPGTGPDGPVTPPNTPTTAAPGPSPTPTVPGGGVVQVAYTASGYTLQGTLEDLGSGRYGLDLWRAGQGRVSQLLLFNRPGYNCLAGGNSVDLAFPEAGADIYTWGLVRADAAHVRVVTTDARSTSATLGAEAYPGIRMWLARIPNDQLDRLEALDANGNILHEAPWAANLDAYPDRC
jgi:hypothetical protein